MKGILAFVLIAQLYTYTEGCTCFNPDINRPIACDSDFIIKTRIKSNLKSPKGPPTVEQTSYYKTSKPRSDHIYMFNGVVSIINLKKVYTADNSAACGVDTLQKGKTYVLSGRIDEANKRLTIDLCGSWIRPEPISNATMHLLMEFKNKTVNCPPRIVPS